MIICKQCFQTKKARHLVKINFDENLSFFFSSRLCIGWLRSHGSKNRKIWQKRPTCTHAWSFCPVISPRRIDSYIWVFCVQRNQTGTVLPQCRNKTFFTQVFRTNKNTELTIEVCLDLKGVRVFFFSNRKSVEFFACR